MEVLQPNLVSECAQAYPAFQCTNQILLLCFMKTFTPCRKEEETLMGHISKTLGAILLKFGM